MSGTTGSAPPPVYIMVAPQKNRTTDKEHFNKTFPKKVMTGLSIAQIVIFVVVLICDIIALTHTKYGPNNGAVGIWTCVFFGVAGALGVLAAHKPTNCTVIAFMVLCILAACFTIPLVVLSGIGFGFVSRYTENAEVIRWTNAVMFCCALFEAVIAITCSVFTCRAVCCRGSSGEGGTPVIYTASSGAGPVPDVPVTAIQMVPTQIQRSDQDNPPNYDEFCHTSEETKTAAVPEEGEKYQRFQ